MRGKVIMNMKVRPVGSSKMLEPLTLVLIL